MPACGERGAVGPAACGEAAGVGPARCGDDEGLREGVAGAGVGVVDAAGEAAGDGGGLAGFGTPSTAPVAALRKTGFGAGTKPSADARAANASGASKA